MHGGVMKPGVPLRRGSWWGSLVVVLLMASAQVHAAQEVWVVNGRSLDIAVIDSATDTEVATIPLDDIDGDGTADPGAPAPSAVDFSTVPGQAGDFAFVTQGQYLRVIDVRARAVVQTIDLEPLLAPATRLAGLASARPARFFAGAAGRVIVTYLHVAATVDSDGDGNGEALFVVLDQQELVAPTGTSPLVAQGSLEIQPGQDLTALGVTEMGVGDGPWEQRIWYSMTRAAGGGGTPAAQITTLVSKGRNLSDPWQVGRRQESPLSGGSLPQRLRLDAPPDREMPVAPLPGEKRLKNLLNGGRCELAFAPSAVAVAGPGWDTYTVLAIDENLDQLFRVNSRTCAVDEFPAGLRPVDVQTLGRVQWRKAYVANQDDDSLTVLNADGSLRTILLASGGTPCQRCPESLGAQTTSANACTVQDLMAVKAGPDTDLSWTGVGCQEGTIYMIWCSCLKDDLTPCPPECQGPPPLSTELALPAYPLVGPPGPGPTTETPWEPLGYTADSVYTVQGLLDVFLGVTPCEYDCPP